MNLKALSLVPVLVLALGLGACGSSSDSGSTGTSGSTATSGSTTSTIDAARAKEECLKQAKQVQDANARTLAEQACQQLGDAGAQVDSALSSAKKLCIENANKIPVDSVKKSALEACDKIQ